MDYVDSPPIKELLIAMSRTLFTYTCAALYLTYPHVTTAPHATPTDISERSTQ